MAWRQVGRDRSGGWPRHERGRTEMHSGRERRGGRARYRETPRIVDVTALARKPCNRCSYPPLPAAIRRLTGVPEPRNTKPAMFKINFPVNRFA